MKTMPIDQSQALEILASEPRPQFKDREGREAAIDRATGAQLHQVDVMFAFNGRAEVITVKVPEPGLGKGLKVGMPVVFTGLVASAWENEINGKDRHGISLRADAVTVKTAA
ncbi:hypothetical protein ACFWBF_27660 [Streptomyces sp. NPDC060028]|uniref:SCO3933 family regulatory protein n=1 Tax=unclassified Streptomyces TaxID=2593676 RepID=UPI0022535B0F|nr:hypothetical protein [Streptomyces sp. NBC_00347]MCX5122913.1 hypothetical protein [Streptomyces sp. NBC_00347]